MKSSFASGYNGEPLMAKLGLKFAVDFENVMLNVPNVPFLLVVQCYW